MPLPDSDCVSNPLWRARLQGLGVGGLWLAGDGEAGLNPQAPGLVALAAQAQSAGLGMVVEVSKANHPAALLACDPGPRTPAEGLKSAALPRLCDQGAMAPSVHAALTQSFKAHDGTWPCWAWPIGPSDSDSTDNRQAVHAKRRQLLCGIQLALKGSPLLHRQEICQWDTQTYDWMAKALHWRKNQSALVLGRFRLLPMHDNLLMFYREHGGQRILCVFNLSDRYVRTPLPLKTSRACLISGSGLEGGRVIQGQIDCDPWGALFALIHA